MLTQVNKIESNINVLCEENNELWGLSFLVKEDNTEEIAILKEHLNDEELQEVIAYIQS